MIMKHVNSSNLVRVGYDESDQTLRIEFRSGTYDYFNVPAHVYTGLLNAASHGSYHAQHIKDVYRYRRL